MATPAVNASRTPSATIGNHSFAVLAIGNDEGHGQTAMLAREVRHHVSVRDNIVHEHPGSGINALFADWVRIESKRVSRVARYSPYGASVLNTFRARDVDSNTTDYKMIVRGKVASEAQSRPHAGIID